MGLPGSLPLYRVMASARSGCAKAGTCFELLHRKVAILQYLVKY